MIRILNESSFNESHVFHITCSCFQDTVSIFDCKIRMKTHNLQVRIIIASQFSISSCLVETFSREKKPMKASLLRPPDETLRDMDIDVLRSWTGFELQLDGFFLWYNWYLKTALLKLTSKVLNKCFIIYAFRVLNIKIFLKLTSLQIRFQLPFISK